MVILLNVKWHQHGKKGVRKFNLVVRLKEKLLFLLIIPKLKIYHFSFQKNYGFIFDIQLQVKPGSVRFLRYLYKRQSQTSMGLL